MTPIEEDSTDRKSDEEIHDDTLTKLKNSNFVGSMRNESKDLPNAFEENLLDFGNDNIAVDNKASENDKNVESVVFDSIFSNDNGMWIFFFFKV